MYSNQPFSDRPQYSLGETCHLPFPTIGSNSATLGNWSAGGKIPRKFYPLPHLLRQCLQLLSNDQSIFTATVLWLENHKCSSAFKKKNIWRWWQKAKNLIYHYFLTQALQPTQAISLGNQAITSIWLAATQSMEEKEVENTYYDRPPPQHFYPAFLLLQFATLMTKLKLLKMNVLLQIREIKLQGRAITFTVTMIKKMGLFSPKSF